jgi:hypothetical protein
MTQEGRAWHAPDQELIYTKSLHDAGSGLSRDCTLQKHQEQQLH